MNTSWQLLKWQAPAKTEKVQGEMAPTHRKQMNHQATWEANSIDHNTLLQNQNESSFSFKERKEKIQQKKTNHVIHTHSDGKTVRFKRTTPPCQTPQLPHKLHNISETFTSVFFFQKGVKNIWMETECATIIVHIYFITHNNREYIHHYSAPNSW